MSLALVRNEFFIVRHELEVMIEVAPYVPNVGFDTNFSLVS